METLNTIIQFTNSQTENSTIDPNASAATGDFNFLILILLLLLAALSLFLFSRKKKKSLLGVFTIAVIGLAFSISPAFAQEKFDVYATDYVTANYEDNLCIQNGCIENKGAEAVALSQITIDNIEENNSVWTIAIGGQTVYSESAGKTQNIFPAIKIDAGQKIDVSYTSNMNKETFNKYLHKNVAKVSFNVYETDVNCQAKDLKVNDKSSPIDIDTNCPTFSWKLSSTLVNQKQTAYVLSIKSSGAELWNSGKVNSQDIECQPNLNLVDKTDYTWDLTLYDKFGWEIPTASSTFSTAYLNIAMPDSKYISYESARCLPGGDRYISNYTIDFDFIPEKNGDSELASANICFNMINSQNFMRWNFIQEDEHINLVKQQMVNGNLKEIARVNNISSLDNFINKQHHTKIDVKDTKIITTFDNKEIDTATFIQPVYLYKLGFYTKQAMPPEIHEVSFVTNIVVKSNNKEIYKNNFDKGIIEFHHAFTAQIVEKENKHWLMLGNGNTFSRPEPLVEWDNETGNLPAFRKEFDCTKQIANAKLYTSGLGCYEAYINGERVGEYQLQDNFTENKYTQFYLVNDVTNLLQNHNTISAAVGDAWWADTCAAYSGAEDAFRAELIIKYTDGSISQINTDTTWKAASANPITKSCIFGGESYDSRTDTSWKFNGFNDSKWTNAKINNEFSGTLKAWIGNKIIERKDLLLTPQTIYTYNGVQGQSDTQYGNVIKNSQPLNVSYTINPGETLLVDFGQNASGWESFQVSGNIDTCLTIKHAEVLNEENGVKSRGNDGPGGSAYYANLRCAQATTHYILNGNTETYHPSMTFYGYRYIEFSADKPVTLSNIQSHIITSVESDNGTFTTNNADLNQLVHNAKWGMYSNYLGVPTDCPQRDERQGWTADTQVFSEAGIYLSDAKTFLEKFCYDMKDAQVTHRPDGAYPGMCPSGGFFFDRDCGCFGWADAGIILPYTLYCMYGDTSVIENNWNSMEHYVKDFIKNNCTDTHHGPVRGWGDHLAPRGEDNDDLVKDILCSEFYCYDLKMMDEMQNLLGKHDTYYKEEFEKEKQWFLNNYFKDNKLTKNTTQTVCLYALYLNLIPNNYVNDVVNNLVSDIKQQGTKLGTGFLGTKILLDVLVANGQTDLAYQLLLNKDCPSWLYPITQGATTFWERWNSYTKEEGYGQLAGMNSFNHYAYGGVIAWMYKNMAGIQADFEHPGFKEIIMKPIPTTAINEINATYESAYGPISVTSKFDGAKWEYNFSIPCGSCAQLTLPDSFSKITINGKNIIDLNIEIDGAELINNNTVKINTGNFSLLATN